MSRAVLAPFEAYQKARVTFVQTVAELAQRPQNIEALQSAGKLFFLALRLFIQSKPFGVISNLKTETDLFLIRRYGSLETSLAR